MGEEDALRNSTKLITELNMILWSQGKNPEIKEMNKIRPLKSGLHLLVRYL